MTDIKVSGSLDVLLYELEDAELLIVKSYMYYRRFSAIKNESYS